MVQRMPSADVVVKRKLSNLVAVQQAIIDADNSLGQSIQRPDLKQYFSQFKSMDQKHLNNYQQVLQTFGGSQGNPDKVTQSLIGECKQVFNDTNIPDIEKLGCYTMLVHVAKEGSGLLAHYGSLKGNDNISRLMSECFHEDFYHIEAINVAAHKEISMIA